MRNKTVSYLAFSLFILGILLAFLLREIDSLRSLWTVSNRSADSISIPSRIIATAPSIVETIYALGEESRIVGVSNFTTYPPEAKKKENIGGLIDPDYEKILQLKSDLVIIQGEMQKHEAFCQEKKIPLLRVDMDSLETIYEGIRAIGAALGCVEKAENLSQEIQLSLDRIHQTVSTIHSMPTVFICLGRRAGSLTGVFTMHPTSFLSDLLQIAGGRNIFKDVQGRYPQISKESLLVRNPDVILELHPGEDISSESVRSMREDWNAMPTLSAVANHRIHIVTDDCMLIPGPRIIQTAQRFYELFHEDHE